MTDASVTTPGDWDLKKTETAMQQMEGIYGALRSFSRLGKETNPKNKSTYDVGPTPVTRATLNMYTGAQPPSIEGKTLVASGDLWVSGKLTKVAAHR